MLKFCLSPVKSLFPKKIFFLLTFIFLGTIFLTKPPVAQAAPGDSWQVASGTWRALGDLPNPCGSLAAIDNDYTVTVLCPDGRIYYYDLTTLYASYITAPLASGEIAIALGGVTITSWPATTRASVLSSVGNVYYYNNGPWTKLNTTTFPGNAPVDIYNNTRVLNANGDIYSVPLTGGTWTKVNSDNLPGSAKAVAIEIDDVTTKIGDVYRLSGGAFAQRNTSAFPPWANSLIFAVDNTGGYVVARNGEIYQLSGSTWIAENTATGPPGGFVRSAAAGYRHIVLEGGGPISTLNVKAFNDADADGIKDAGEDFTTFGSSVGAVALDGNSITPNASGDYTAIISASPASHILGLDPNNPIWEATQWSGPSCASSGCAYTPSGSYYNTGSFQVATGGTITVYLGVRIPPAADGTLVTKVFHDKDNDGVLDSGEAFTDFTNQAEVRLDSETGTVIYPNSAGNVSTSLSSGSHTIFIKPYATTFWDKTRWDDCPCPSTPAVYTFSSGWWRTSSVTVPSSGTLTVYLGIRQLAQLTITYFPDKNFNGQRDSGEDFNYDWDGVISSAYITNAGVTNNMTTALSLGLGGTISRNIVPTPATTTISTDINEDYHWRETQWNFTNDSSLSTCPPYSTWKCYPTFSGTGTSIFSHTGNFQLAPGTAGTVYLGVAQKDFLVTANGRTSDSMIPTATLSPPFSVKIESLRGYCSVVDATCTNPFSPIIPLYADGNVSLSTSCTAIPSGSCTGMTTTLASSSVSVTSTAPAFVDLNVSTSATPFGDYQITVSGSSLNLPATMSGHSVNFFISVKYPPWFQTQGGDVGSVGSGFGSGTGKSFSVRNEGTLYNANPDYLVAYNKDKDGFLVPPLASGGKNWFVDAGGNLGTKPSFYNELWSSLKLKAVDFDTNGSLPCPVTGDCVLRYTGVTGGFPFIPGAAACSRACIVFVPKPPPPPAPATRSIDIDSDLGTSSTPPMIFVAEGGIYIKKEVTAIYAYLITDLITVIGSTGALNDSTLTIRGGLIGNKSLGEALFYMGDISFLGESRCLPGSAGAGGICFGRNLGNTLNQTIPGETIIWQPKYLALLRQIAGISKFTWTEIAP